MRRFEERDSAEVIKIGQKIKVKIRWWANSLVPETHAIYEDWHVNGEGSVRIYKIPENHTFIVGDEVEGTVAKVSVTSQLTRDGRKKIYVNLQNLERVYSLRTSHCNDKLTITVRSGDNIVKQDEFPDIKVQYAGDISELKVDSEVQITISGQGMPLSELIKGSDSDNEIGRHTIRTYQFNGDYKFEKSDLIKARVESISTGDVLAPFKWKRVVVTLRDPKRIYSHRIYITESHIAVERYCGEKLLKTRLIPITKTEGEALYDNHIYRVICKSYAHSGRPIIRTYQKLGSVDALARDRLTSVRLILPKAGNEHLRRIRKALNELPRLSQKPQQYDHFADRAVFI